MFATLFATRDGAEKSVRNCCGRWILTIDKDVAPARYRFRELMGIFIYGKVGLRFVFFHIHSDQIRNAMEAFAPSMDIPSSNESRRAPIKIILSIIFRSNFVSRKNLSIYFLNFGWLSVDFFMVQSKESFTADGSTSDGFFGFFCLSY
jgi:hypothetical protein